MKNAHIIAIDGPAGSGKSTIARLLAKKLGYLYIDSGALYRAVTLFFLKQNINFTNTDLPVSLLDDTDVRIEPSENGLVVILDKENITEAIRTNEVTRYVSKVAENPLIREHVNLKLRDMVRNKSVVLDGRDIGTVVFPDADVKIFMSASLEERAKRRYRELRQKGLQVDIKQVKIDIEKRDEHDRLRAVAPLKQADDAVLVDTTGCSIDEVVESIVRVVQTQDINHDVQIKKS